MENLKAIRESFPILKNKIQLSSCSQSAMHMEVRRAMNDYTESWAEQGMNWGKWMEACEQARSLFAEMVNSDPSEVAIVSSVSHAISSIATSLQPAANKNKVIVTDFDFPTVGHVWLSHSEKYQIDFIHTNQNRLESIEYENFLDDQTLLLSTSHVNFYNGFKQDLEAIAKKVHQNESLFLVDAYQSAGQTPIDVKEMDIDILTAGMQKYMLGIPGIAFLYIKKEIAEQLSPKVTGWFGQENPFAFDIRNVTYANAARRFDTGTFPMINGFAANAALRVLREFDMREIEKHLQHLSTICIEEARNHGLTIKSPTNVYNKGSNTAIYVKNASEVEHTLHEKGIIVSARNDVIRIAPHFYNTEKDIRTAIYELSRVI